MGLPLTFVTIIPVKAFDEGKSRLGDVLDSADRQQLCRQMLERTLALFDDDEDVVIVSGDPRVEALSRDLRPVTRYLRAEPPHSLNRALRQACGAVPSGKAMVVLPTDLMLLDRATFMRFVEDPNALMIASDAAVEGTNLLHVPAQFVGIYRFAFGPGSFRRHLGEAARLGITPRIDRSPAIALDVDTPADLQRVGLFHPGK